MRTVALKKESFPWREFIRSVMAIAIPVALQNLLTTTGSMIDTMMLAPLGELTVGAVGLCAQFSSLMFTGYWGFVGGGMLFFAQYYGAKDDEGINRSYGITLSFMMLVGFVFGLAAILFPEIIMKVYTDKTSLQQLGVQYLRIIGFAYPLQVYAMACSALLRTTDKVRIPLYGGIAGVVTNCLLNFLLIEGRFGFPALGIRGAAVATVCSAAVNVVVILVLAKVQKHPYLLRLSRHFRWNLDSLKAYLRKCFPIILNEVAIGVGAMIMNIVLGRQSEAAIAGLAVFRTMEGFIIGFFAGFSNASSVLVGTQVGAGNLKLAYERAKRVVLLCDCFILLGCLLLISVHTPLFHAMSLSGESFDLCFGMLLIYSMVALFRMGNWTQNDTYRSAGDAATGTILEIVFLYLMVVPCVCLSGLVFKLPFLAVFACCYIDEPIRFLLMQLHMYSGKWVRPVTPEGKAALPAFMAERRLSREKRRGQAAV